MVTEDDGGSPVRQVHFKLIVLTSHLSNKPTGEGGGLSIFVCFHEVALRNVEKAEPSQKHLAGCKCSTRSLYTLGCNEAACREPSRLDEINRCHQG
jgi:hypothetical protein